MYVCPNPEEVETAAAAELAQDTGARTHDSVGGRAGGEGLVLDRLEPVLHASFKRSELTCLDWSPHDPTLLLAGASDGASSCFSARSPLALFFPRRWLWMELSSSNSDPLY